MNSWLISVNGTLGEKAYFFDPYKLTLYAQPDLIKWALGGRTIFTFLEQFDVIFDFQNVNFGDYTIRYYTGGIKLRIVI